MKNCISDLHLPPNPPRIYFHLAPSFSAKSHFACRPQIFMGKRPPPELRYYARRFSDRLKSAKIASSSNSKTLDPPCGGGMEGSPAAAAKPVGERVPLGDVVSDCVRRWFQDTLKEARGGDTAMQVLVGQMYHSGYGVARNDGKAKAWITKASKYRSSVWKVSEKRPGYNASDSDSEEVKDDKN